jgi:2-polyprenyl-3-methyl-5-hydroxy-6-metoxy-1,4-benzoquinol methylase
MDTQTHWDHVYQTKSAGHTSWYLPHLHTSLDWISAAAPDRSASIIDVGGGESTLADDLLALGYRNITVLDLSEAAITKSQHRLGSTANQINWLAADITTAALPPRSYDLWHDRAVFHFLTDPAQRRAYARQLASCLRSSGHAIIATFGPEGPQRCSGLPTNRYNAASLLQELGPDFRISKSAVLDHHTPFGTTQQFLYCDFTLS